MKPPIPAIFRYVGSNANRHARKTFFIEVEPDEVERMSKFPYPTCFSGVVIKNDLPNHYVGEHSHKWINPFQDMHNYGMCDFQRVMTTK